MARSSTPERRWMLLSHVLFGVTLGVPTIVTVVSRPPGAMGTLAIAAAFAVWYVVMFAARPDWEARTGRTVAYAVGALAFYAVLNVRDQGFFLVLYALLPQFFPSLPRWLAVLGVMGIVVAPAAAEGELRSLLTDSEALFSVLASVGLGLAVTAIIDPRAALGEELAEHSAGVRGVALVRSRGATSAQRRPRTASPVPRTRHATACERRGAPWRRCGPSRSNTRRCPTRCGTSLHGGASRSGTRPGSRSSSMARGADVPGCRRRPAARRAGGADQRRPPRRGIPGRPDPVLPGRPGAARRPGR
ncbi:MAG TPA: hypothetical protein VK923_15940, partial [Euzebyales bacterium]|nr:hypothetical protein [Euzebyales bacterium]